MSNLSRKIEADWQDTANFVLGLWLIVSPWMLGYAGEASPTGHAIITGAIIAAVAAAALFAFRPWEEWINVAAAAWLAVSPWVLGYSTNQVAVWNQIVIAVPVLLLALWSMAIEHDPGDMAVRH
jgi:hypothetical protein